MKVQLLISFSQSVYKELTEVMPLQEMDAYTSTIHDENMLRERYSNEIFSFFREKQNYIKKIQDANKKRGEIVLAYEGQNGYYNKLPLLYEEDLQGLQMKEFDSQTFIHKIKNRTQTALKNSTGREIASFFESFPFIYRTTYNIRRGYNKLCNDIAYQQTVCDSPEKRELLKIFRDGLEEDNQDYLELMYFHARRIYQYGKSHDFFQKKQVANLAISPNLPKEPMKVVDRGTIEIYPRSFNSFLEDYVKKHPGERTSISDVAYEYELECTERSFRR